MLFFKKVLFHNASLIFMFSYVLKEDNFFSQWVMCGSVHREFWFWLSSFFNSFIVVVVQSPSCVWLFATPRIATRQASLSSTIPQSLTSSCSLHQWCHPAISSSDALFSFCPQSFPASGTFPTSSVHIRWPKYWRLRFSISLLIRVKEESERAGLKLNI